MINQKPDIKEQVNYALRELSGSIDALYMASNLYTINRILEQMRIQIANLIYLNEIRDRHTTNNTKSPEEAKQSFPEEAKQLEQTKTQEELQASTAPEAAKVPEEVKPSEETNVSEETKSSNETMVSELDWLVSQLIEDNAADEEKQ